MTELAHDVLFTSALDMDVIKVGNGNGFSPFPRRVRREGYIVTIFDFFLVSLGISLRPACTRVFLRSRAIVVGLSQRQQPPGPIVAYSPTNSQEVCCPSYCMYLYTYSNITRIAIHRYNRLLFSIHTSRKLKSEFRT